MGYTHRYLITVFQAWKNFSFFFSFPFFTFHSSLFTQYVFALAENHCLWTGHINDCRFFLFHTFFDDDKGDLLFMLTDQEIGIREKWDYLIFIDNRTYKQWHVQLAHDGFHHRMIRDAET